MESVKQVQPNTQQKKSNFARNAVLATTVTSGTLFGANYGMNNLVPEADEVKIKKMSPTTKQFYNGFADCFNMKNAEKALKDNKINQETLDKINDVKAAAIKSAKSEENLSKIGNTPIEKRKMTFNEALKESRKANKNLTKKNVRLRKDYRELEKLEIFNKTKFEKVIQAEFKKKGKILKILAKPAAIGAAIFGGVGLIVGIGVNSLFPKKED